LRGFHVGKMPSKHREAASISEVFSVIAQLLCDGVVSTRIFLEVQLIHHRAVLTFRKQVFRIVNVNGKGREGEREGRLGLSGPGPTSLGPHNEP
jgi:hypothetical protein